MFKEEKRPNKDGYFKASFVATAMNGEKKRIVERSKKSQADADRKLDIKKREYEKRFACNKR